MSKKVENFEEAKQIIIDFQHSDINKERLALYKKRAIFLTAVTSCAAIAGSIAMNYPEFALIVSPAVALVSSTRILPYLRAKKTMREVDKGSYFDMISQDDAIKQATEIENLKSAYEAEDLGGKKR